MPRAKLTDRTILSLTSPGRGQVDYFDALLPGFGVRVSQSGRRSFVVLYRYNGLKRRMTLGTYPVVTLADAREKARQALADANDGKDPAIERKRVRKGLSIEELAEQYIEKHAKPKKRSWKKDRSYLNNSVLPKFGRWKAEDLTKTDLLEMLEEKGRTAPITANRTFEVVRKMYNWANAREIISHNPCGGLGKLFKETSRERVLSAEEIHLVWWAIDSLGSGDEGSAAFKLLMLTGQREMEVVKMSWGDIGWTDRIWTIPVDDSKNQKAHVVPLSAAAIDILKKLYAGRRSKVWAFPQEREDKPRARSWLETRINWIREDCGVRDFTIHDIRRTISTNLAALGTSDKVIDMILNHVDSSVGGIYNRYRYLAEKRAALDAWAVRLATLAEDAQKAILALAAE